MAVPLIVTLDLDEATQTFLDAERRRYFPPERNVLAAHVTLFHALPGDDESEVRAALTEVARRPAFPVRVTGVRFLGKGVAYDLAAPPAEAVRADIAQRFASVLTRQDAQRFRGHVTVANKLSPDRARALFAQLDAAFVPREGRAVALSLHRYVGGPWEFVEAFPFEARPSESSPA